MFLDNVIDGLETLLLVCGRSENLVQLLLETFGFCNQSFNVSLGRQGVGAECRKDFSVLLLVILRGDTSIDIINPPLLNGGYLVCEVRVTLGDLELNSDGVACGRADTPPGLCSPSRQGRKRP